MTIELCCIFVSTSSAAAPFDGYGGKMHYQFNSFKFLFFSQCTSTRAPLATLWPSSWGRTTPTPAGTSPPAPGPSRPPSTPAITGTSPRRGARSTSSGRQGNRYFNNLFPHRKMLVRIILVCSSEGRTNYFCRV